MENFSLALSEVGHLCDEIIILVDKNRKIYYCNKNVQNDFASEEGSLFNTQIGEDTRQPTLQVSIRFFDLIQTNQSINNPFRTQFVNKRSERVTIEWRSTPLSFASKQESPTILLIGRDISSEVDKDERIDDLEVQLNSVIEIMAGNYWWKDTNGIYKGFNSTYLNLLGVQREEVVGKTDYDLPWSNTAHQLIENDRQVMVSGMPYKTQEEIRASNGEVRIFDIFKAPLKNKKGEIIGTIGNSIDVTERRSVEAIAKTKAEEAERLSGENKLQQILLQEQEKSKKIADQVAHDIRSPLASMLMIVKACQAIPERERIALREAATTINDIANNLLSAFEKKENKQYQEPKDEEHEALLVSPIILQILTDKKYQYQSLPVKFEHHFSQKGNFAWIKSESTAFKRMLSNVINNAVDALVLKEGKITLYLDADDKHVNIAIMDNGKGMSPELVQKILNHMAVTEGKENGHGIGLIQVRDTLQNSGGQWTLDSRVGVGTKVILTFPRVQSKNWIAESIQLNADDTVVILDDDSSIHIAWDTHFDKILKNSPSLTIMHFEMGQEAVDFLNSLAPDKKQKVFLLTDYELLKQDLNGLDVIKQTGITRSILVTSHYFNKTVRLDAGETETKILPKQLASDIPIHIIPLAGNDELKMTDSDLKKVYAIFVDDDQSLLDSFKFLYHDKKVDTYQNPQKFLENMAQYHRSTKIMLDYHFANSDKQGVQIAEELHALGFTRLYLFSGAKLSSQMIPPHLTVIQKTDLNKLDAVLKEEYSY